MCANRDCRVCGQVEVGESKGEDKFQGVREMSEERARHIQKAIKAQASTEFGSVQQPSSPWPELATNRTSSGSCG